MQWKRIHTLAKHCQTLEYSLRFVTWWWWLSTNCSRYTRFNPFGCRAYECHMDIVHDKEEYLLKNNQAKIYAVVLINEGTTERRGMINSSLFVCRHLLFSQWILSRALCLYLFGRLCLNRSTSIFHWLKCSVVDRSVSCQRLYHNTNLFRLHWKYAHCAYLMKCHFHSTNQVMTTTTTIMMILKLKRQNSLLIHSFLQIITVATVFHQLKLVHTNVIASGWPFALC